MDDQGRLASERLQIALDLYGAAESIQRENLRRRQAEPDEAEVQELLLRWLSKAADRDDRSADDR